MWRCRTHTSLSPSSLLASQVFTWIQHHASTDRWEPGIESFSSCKYFCGIFCVIAPPPSPPTRCLPPAQNTCIKWGGQLDRLTMYAQLDTQTSGEVSRATFSIPHIGSSPLTLISLLWVLPVLTERCNPVVGACEWQLLRIYLQDKNVESLLVYFRNWSRKKRIKKIEHHRCCSCRFSNKGVS